MKALSLVAVILLVGCSGSPTAPTPPPFVPVTITPPVVTPPVAPVPLPPAFPPNDPRFDLAFYRAFVHDAFERRGDFVPLQRQPEAPRIYLRTVDDAGRPMDAMTLDQTAAALESTAGSLTGVFGLAGIERGTGTREGQRGWITVRWEAEPNDRYCGFAYVGGDLIVLSPRTPRCRCAGGPAVRLETVKHELGHALGFWHTGNVNDLMFGGPRPGCDRTPSPREVYHAAVAYTRPIGSLAP